MIDKINELSRQVEAFAPKTTAEIEEFRIRLLGKKGELTALMEAFKGVAPELKRELGQKLNALKTAAEALKAIGGSGDPAKIADDVKTAQTTIDTLRTDHQKEIARIQKNTALRLALADKAHDPADIISLLDLDKIEVDDAGGLKTDLEGLLKPLKETKSYLFKSQEPEKNPVVKGAKPADPGARQEPTLKADGPVVI